MLSSSSEQKTAAFVRALNGQSFSIGCEHEQRWMAEQIYIYRTYLFRQWTIKCIAISSVKYKSKLSCYQFFQKTNEKIMPLLARSNFYKYFVRFLEYIIVNKIICFWNFLTFVHNWIGTFFYLLIPLQMLLMSSEKLNIFLSFYFWCVTTRF